MSSCSDCIHCNIDYIWDEVYGEEYETSSCDKDRDEFMSEIPIDCPRFTEYPPHKEQSTKCDKCNSLHKCFNDGKLLECTLSGDIYKHYIPSTGVICS
jgi:hypothetical protein